MSDDAEQEIVSPSDPEYKIPSGKAMQEVMTLNSSQGGEIVAIIPRTLEEVYRLAQYVCHARIAPKSYDNDPAKVTIGILKAMEVGVAPLTGIASIAIINNRACVWGDLAVALIQSKNILEKMTVEKIGTPPGDAELVQWDNSYGIRVTMWRRGQSEPYVGEFTVGQARRAKLWLNSKKAPWMEYPERQMKWRAFGFCSRDGFADCLMGLAIREEIEDMPPEKDSIVDTSFLDAPIAIEHKPGDVLPDVLAGRPADAVPVAAATQAAKSKDASPAPSQEADSETALTRGRRITQPSKLD
jgi:hypothetical protein